MQEVVREGEGVGKTLKAAVHETGVTEVSQASFSSSAALCELQFEFLGKILHFSVIAAP